jgi:GAF domain-containing protein
MEKIDRFDELVTQVRHLIAGEPDRIANAANVAALLFQSLPDVNWVGFYFCRDDQLVLGPFQGRPACTRIPLGKGVCGTAAEQRRTIVVENVHEFPGHIACDTASNSEMVVPMIRDGRLVGVLDVDSPRLGRFADEDRKALEAVVAELLAAWETNTNPDYS